MAHIVDDDDGQPGADKGTVWRRDGKSGPLRRGTDGPQGPSDEDREATRRMFHARELRKAAVAADRVMSSGLLARAAELEQSAVAVRDGSLRRLSAGERAEIVHLRKMADQVADPITRRGYLTIAEHLEQEGW